MSQPCDIIHELERLFSESPDLVYVFAADHRYLLVNKAAAAEFEMTPMDFIGAHWSELGFSEEVMKPFTERIDEVISDNESVMLTIEGTAERGSRIYQTSITPICREDGIVFGVLVIARDVTSLLP